jgi:hypothetical protein
MWNRLVDICVSLGELSGSFDMRRIVICVAVIASVSGPAALARGGGGGGGHHSSMGPVTGGALGTSPASPGTNSLGTALSSSGAGNGPQKGPLLGTSSAVDQEEAKVNKMIGSICRGC